MPYSASSLRNPVGFGNRAPPAPLYEHIGGELLEPQAAPTSQINRHGKASHLLDAPPCPRNERQLKILQHEVKARIADLLSPRRTYHSMKEGTSSSTSRTLGFIDDLGHIACRCTKEPLNTDPSTSRSYTFFPSEYVSIACQSSDITTRSASFPTSIDPLRSEKP